MRLILTGGGSRVFSMFSSDFVREKLSDNSAVLVGIGGLSRFTEWLLRDVLLVKEYQLVRAPGSCTYESERFCIEPYMDEADKDVDKYGVLRYCKLVFCMLVTRDSVSLWSR